VEHVLPSRTATSVRNLTLAVCVVWFLLALIGSLTGAFDSQPRPPFMLGLSALVPVAVFAIFYRASMKFREFAMSVNPRILMLAQAWRVIGIVFVVLYYRGALPGVFALPAGWGDFCIGITAPIAAWYWHRPLPRRTLALWNLLGILDLVIAVSLGVLASRTPIGILAGDADTRLMGTFPLSLIPTFLVPLFVMFHVICLSHLRTGSRGTESSQA
jgi:hypothetical protein